MIRARAHAFAGCYEKLAKLDDNAAGKILFNWNIGPDGSVLSLSVASSDFPTSEPADCIAAELRQLHFPPAAQATSVRYPFQFRPEPRDPAAYCAAHALRPTGNDPLIEDVEDADRWVRNVDGRSGHWWLTHDDGCQVTPPNPAALAPGRGDSSHYAMRGGARACSGWGFALGFALNGSGGGLCAYDASSYDGVYFWARSGEANVAVHFRAGTRQTEPAGEGGDGGCDAQPNGCWDDYAIDVTLDPTWKLYSAKWSELKQKGWGKAVAFKVQDLSAFTWSTDAQPADYREIWVDQVGFFKGTPPTTPP